MARLATASAMLAMTLALAAGCGDGGEAPEDAVRGYFEDLVEGDGEAACDRLTDQLRAEIDDAPATRAAGGCADVLVLVSGLNRELSTDDVEKLEIDVEENGDEATASFRNPFANRNETIKLEKQGDDWKIATLLTRPTSG